MMTIRTKTWGWVNAFEINCKDTEHYTEKIEEKDGTRYIDTTKSGCTITWFIKH